MSAFPRKSCSSLSSKYQWYSYHWALLYLWLGSSIESKEDRHHRKNYVLCLQIFIIFKLWIGCNFLETWWSKIKIFINIWVEDWIQIHKILIIGILNCFCYILICKPFCQFRRPHSVIDDTLDIVGYQHLSQIPNLKNTTLLFR